MDHTITYQSSFRDDHFKILKNGHSAEKLFKSSWLGWKVFFKGHENEFIFRRKGIYRPVISVTDTDDHLILSAKVRIPFFKNYIKATATFQNGEVFEYRHHGIFKRNWMWTKNDIPVISSKGTNDLLRQEGQVSFIRGNSNNEVLSILGIFLMDSVVRQTRINFRLTLAAICIFIYSAFQYIILN